MIKISGEIAFDKNVTGLLAVNVKDIVSNIDDWPVVYIISNDTEAYVGETTSISTRLEQHLSNQARRGLKEVRIISDETFNKSVILDLESFLISHISADDRFQILQNGNAGQQHHNYYQKEFYESQFDEVWSQLRKLHLASRSVNEIENSNLFKYSPYKSLTTDQYQACIEIVKSLVENINLENSSAYIVEGDPGTGKTILVVYLMKLLSASIQDDVELDDSSLVESLLKIHSQCPELKLGIVIPMENLRSIIKEVFSKTYGLSKKMVLSPSEVARSDEEFDILIVDEAHRLKSVRNMSGFEMDNMRKNNLRLGLREDNGTQLDWIMKKSRFQVLLYDAQQTIKRTDVDQSKFEVMRKNCNFLSLSTQMRCGKEGKEYVEQIKTIFSPKQPAAPRHFAQYDVKIFDDVKLMTEAIREKDEAPGIGLSRNVAGFAWPWLTKGQKPYPNNAIETKKYITDGHYDIEIDGHKYIWNTKANGWVTSANAVNEIGCIHTIQGFDLNYAGVIIGNELKYNTETGHFYVDRDQYFDIMGKNSTDDDDLLQYVFNIYKILCTRGMRGTYIYACDEGLREYLKHALRS